MTGPRGWGWGQILLSCALYPIPNYPISTPGGRVLGWVLGIATSPLKAPGPDNIHFLGEKLGWSAGTGVRRVCLLWAGSPKHTASSGAGEKKPAPSGGGVLCCGSVGGGGRGFGHPPSILPPAWPQHPPRGVHKKKPAKKFCGEQLFLGDPVNGGEFVKNSKKIPREAPEKKLFFAPFSYRTPLRGYLPGRAVPHFQKIEIAKWLTAANCAKKKPNFD